jgi:hypothetical protein
LSLKGAKSPTRGRKLRSAGTKARAHVSNGSNSLNELKKQLEARTRELAEARGHLSKALEQQAATDEVLRVISSSPGDLQPVFQTMLANAVRICEAKFGTLYLCEGDGFRSVALHGLPPAHAEERQRTPVLRPGPNPLFRLARTRQTVHIADIRTEQAYIEGILSFVALADAGGARTLAVDPALRSTARRASQRVRQQVPHPPPPRCQRVPLCLRLDRTKRRRPSARSARSPQGHARICLGQG